MQVHLQIKSESHYERVLDRVFRLMHKKLSNNSPEAKELEKLSSLVEDYERKYYPLVSAL
jgi:antitoxin component HigA of HigAB toxin-antitoxin module